jgi:hypothetical protein
LGAFVACCLKVYDEILEPRLGKHVRSFSYSISYGTLLLGLYRFLDPLKLK